MDQVSAKDLSNILVDFLQRFDYNDDARLAPGDLKSLYDFVLPFLPNNEKIVRELAEYAHCSFPFLPLEIRQAVALYDAFQMSVDDVPIEQHHSLQDLCVQLSASGRIQHPVWSAFFRSFPLLLQHYGPYAQTTLFRGALEFIQATCLERTLFRGYPGSTYPNYVRRMSGQGPVQAAVCFPEREFPQSQYLPFIASLEAELEYFVGTVNDLFSFYKESDSPFERINFPLNEAACSGEPVLQVLRDLVETAMGSWSRMLAILASLQDDRLRGRVVEFYVGYVRYHLSCSRYRIADLGTESGNEQLRRFHQMSLQALGGGSAGVAVGDQGNGTDADESEKLN
ncbi:Trichodiene synthase-domain-containing protein [Aspergillus aurantiobrunneus]